MQRMPLLPVARSDSQIPDFFTLPLVDFLSRYEDKFAPPSGMDAPLELAQAIALSPPLSNMNAVTALRLSPAVVAIAGQLDGATGLLHSMKTQLESSLERARFVSYEEIERCVEGLASKLIALLGPDDIRASRFMAIPRGGNIVLGLLLYALGIESASLGLDSPGTRVIVVDDCALSGLRFRETLESIPADEVVFATLFSHPDLRRAIEETEPQVRACVSAQDLSDFSERMPPGEREAWLSTWRAHNSGYWVGQPEHLVFPWGEPQVGQVDPDSGEVRPGWNLAPPSMCIQHRASLAHTVPPSRKVQVVNAGSGETRLTDTVLYVSMGDELAIIDWQRQQSWKLTGGGPDMLKALLGAPTLAQAAETIVDSYQIDMDTAIEDLTELSNQLVSEGLIETKAKQNVNDDI